MGNAAVLRVLNGPQKAQQLAFDDDREYVVGRKRDCDLPITDGYMSRQHFRIFAEEDAFVIEDAGSSHGTMLNGHKLSARTILQDGDLIKAGQTDFVFQAGTEIRANKASRKTIHGSPKTVFASALGEGKAAAAAPTPTNEASRNVPTELNDVPESLEQLLATSPARVEPKEEPGTSTSAADPSHRPGADSGERSEWDSFWDDAHPGATQSAAESPPYIEPRTHTRSPAERGTATPASQEDEMPPSAFPDFPAPPATPEAPASPASPSPSAPPPGETKEGDDLDWWTA